ncbi:uncharacterized protein LOC111115709 [Crassostrea virginica]
MGISLDYSILPYITVLLFTSRLGAQQLYFCDTPNKDPCEVANENQPFEPEARFENCKHDNSKNFCDRYISPGWYRFYDRMLDRCPELLSCGTLYPSWLNGSHPVEVNTEVVRSVCTVGFASCCTRQVTIKIRNCGQFMAYCLPALDTCPERYCFGTNGPCGAMTTSSSQTEAGSTTVDHSSSQTEAGSTTVDHAVLTVPSTTTPERPNNAEIITESSQTTTQPTQIKSTTVVSSNSEKDGDSAGTSAIAISIGLATAALCISGFLVVFVICYHKRRTSSKENASENPYEGPISVDSPVFNVYELPGKLQTESSVYDELPSEEEYQNGATRDNPYEVILEKGMRKKYQELKE